MARQRGERVQAVPQRGVALRARVRAAPVDADGARVEGGERIDLAEPAAGRCPMPDSCSRYGGCLGDCNAAPAAPRLDRFRALAERWEAKANPAERTYYERKSRTQYEEGREDAMDECSDELLAAVEEVERG